MKRLICVSLFFLVFSASANTLFADEQTESEVKAPAQLAKEYIASKHNYDIDELRVGDSLIGRSGAQIDINHGYDTERVLLKRKDFESPWKVESSEPLHQY